jgi:hypothetical protein
MHGISSSPVSPMSKWTRTRRDPGRTYHDEAERELRKDVKSRLRELVEIGLEAESAYVDLVDTLEPGMTKARRKELIRQFRDGVYEQQQRGLRRR